MRGQVAAQSPVPPKRGPSRAGPRSRSPYGAWAASSSAPPWACPRVQPTIRPRRPTRPRRGGPSWEANTPGRRGRGTVRLGSRPRRHRRKPANRTGARRARYGSIRFEQPCLRAGLSLVRILGGLNVQLPVEGGEADPEQARSAALVEARASEDVE